MVHNRFSSITIGWLALECRNSAALAASASCKSWGSIGGSSSWHETPSLCSWTNVSVIPQALKFLISLSFRLLPDFNRRTPEKLVTSLDKTIPGFSWFNLRLNIANTRERGRNEPHLGPVCMKQPFETYEVMLKIAVRWVFATISSPSVLNCTDKNSIRQNPF